MRRSALVWDYGPQTKAVERARLLYAEHLAVAHHEAAPAEPAPAAQPDRRPRVIRTLRRVGTARIAVGCAAIVLILLAVFLHVA
jgi:hypothetical protein